MLGRAEVMEFYRREMAERGVDIGDPLEESDQCEWDSLYALYLRGVEDGKREKEVGDVGR